MKEEDRQRIVSGLTEPTVVKMDIAVCTEYYCDHEYGITDGENYLCLDCGEAWNKEWYQNLYKVDPEYDLREICKRYLELLLTMSSRDAVEVLKKEYDMKLASKKVYVKY